MEFYRAYGQPNFPEDYTFKVFGLDVAREDNMQYSQALKNACIKNAGPKPARPTSCPRCRVANARFSTRVCYKAGIAGAWNMICLSCDRVHIPNQTGPTDAALQRIEAIRARNIEAYLESKAKRAKQRAKARAKPREEECEADTAVVKNAATPFGNLNNALKLLGAGKSIPPGGHKKPKAQRKEKVAVTYGHINYIKRLHTFAGKSDGAEEKPRTVELIYWAQDQEPIVELVPVQFGHELFLYEFEYFKNMRGPCLFERYAFEASMWCDLPWQTSPIWVAPEDDVVFIRAMGITCRGFGRQLDRYQRMHDLALSPALGIRAKVSIPPARHQWLVVWGPNGGAPEIHLVDLSIAHTLDDETRLTLPWAHLIADAPFLLIWRETETGWAAVRLGVSSGVLAAPITLVANPSAETLVGSGEAIAWLEEWRMGGGPRSRPSSPDNRKGGSTKRDRDLPTSRIPRRVPLPTSSATPARVHKVSPSSTSVRRDGEVGDGAVIRPHGVNTAPEPRGRKAAPSAASVPLAEHVACSVALTARKSEHAPRPVAVPARKADIALERVAPPDQKTEDAAPPVDLPARKAEAATRPVALPARKPALAARPVALARKTESASDAVALPARKEELAVGQAGHSVILLALPAWDSGAGNHGVHAQKRPAPASCEDAYQKVDDRLSPAEAHALKKIRIDDDDIVVIDGPCPAKASRNGASHKGPAAKKRSCNSVSDALADEDVVIIENPSDALKRSFRRSARASAPSAPASTVSAAGQTSVSSAGRAHPIGSGSTALEHAPEQSSPGVSSDDEPEFVEGPSFATVSRETSNVEVEFVEGAPIVPKRRVSNINGREVIDLT